MSAPLGLGVELGVTVRVRFDKEGRAYVDPSGAPYTVIELTARQNASGRSDAMLVRSLDGKNERTWVKLYDFGPAT